MAPKYILEQFLQQELLINITEHEVAGGTLPGRGGSGVRVGVRLKTCFLNPKPLTCWGLVDTGTWGIIQGLHCLQT